MAVGAFLEVSTASIFQPISGFSHRKSMASYSATPTSDPIPSPAVVLDGRNMARLPKKVAAALMKYTPQIPESDWSAIREFVQDAVAAASDTSTLDPERVQKITAPFVHWAVNGQGLPLEAPAIFVRHVIDGYCDSRVLLQDGSVSTYRSILRAVADRVAPEENPEPFRPISRRNIQDPYVTSEVDRFRAWARGQRTTTQTRRAKLLLSAGAGAGLRPGEIGSIRPRDVFVSDSGITISVQATLARQVTLLAEWEEMFLEAIKGMEPADYVWGQSPSPSRNKNLITEFSDRCIGVAPVPSRLRASWLVTLLDRRVHMAVIFDASGFKQFNNLHQYISFLTKPGSQDARAQLRSGDRA